MSKSMDQVLKEMQNIVASTNNFVGGKLDSISTKIDDNHKEIIAKLSSIEQHIIQPSQKCEPPRNVNTAQYNTTASQLSPMGKCLYRGKEVNYFGICKTCGQPIMSPSAVAYCMVNKLDITCYTCQKGGTHRFKAEFLPGDVNATPTATPTPSNANNTVPPTPLSGTGDTRLILPCEICGKPRRYKSAMDFIEKSREAERHGFPKVMCSACARQKVAEMKSQQAEVHYMDYDLVLGEMIIDIEIGNRISNLTKAILATGSVDHEDSVAAKKALYDRIKELGQQMQLAHKLNIKLEDVKAIYKKFYDTAVNNADGQVEKTMAEKQSSSLSVDEVISHILCTSNMTADKIVAMKFADLKDFLLEEDIEFAFNGREWNTCKKRAYELEKAIVGEEVAPTQEQELPQLPPLPQEAIMTQGGNDTLMTDNIGF